MIFVEKIRNAPVKNTVLSANIPQPLDSIVAGIQYVGFKHQPDGRFYPTDAPVLELVTLNEDGTTTGKYVEPGTIRFRFTRELTAEEDAQLQVYVTNHDPDALTDEQTRMLQDADDLVYMLNSLNMIRNDVQFLTEVHTTWPDKTKTQRTDAIRDTIGRVARDLETFRRVARYIVRKELKSEI